MIVWCPSNKFPSVDEKLQKVLTNRRLSAPVQVGIEVAKVLFTEDELASSIVTCRRVNGQIRQSIDPAKLCLIDNLVKRKCGLVEAEFSAIRSGIRDSLANCCKCLRLKLAPKDMSVVWTNFVPPLTLFTSLLTSSYSIITYWFSFYLYLVLSIINASSAKGCRTRELPWRHGMEHCLAAACHLVTVLGEKAGGVCRAPLGKECCWLGGW